MSPTGKTQVKWRLTRDLDGSLHVADRVALHLADVDAAPLVHRRDHDDPLADRLLLLGGVVLDEAALNRR